ncbi:hypothetical protein PtB15_1B128 [Puccinia triticina]|nr:hypothetical protein PtB15_1B128 [Puccinia triticina]
MGEFFVCGGTALERQSSSRPLACHDWPLTSENRYGNPPITNTASAAPLLPRSSKPQGTLETSVKRGPGRGCIPTLDARLSRLENLLGEALPNASQVLNPGKYASGLANNSSTTDHRWASYPSQLSLAGARTRRVSQDSTLELPEDPLLDGAMEDALLAGQPIHQLYSCGNAAGLPKKGNLSTARLFLESSRKSKNPRESARRESSRIRTPSTQPGYVPTQQDSRRSLVSPAPASDRRQGSRKASKKRKVTVSSDDDAPDPHNPSQRDTTTQNPFSGTTQVASRTGEIVVIDTAQDSEEENGKKSARSQKKKDADKDKDGYDHVRLYFYTPGSGTRRHRLGMQMVP